MRSTTEVERRRHPHENLEGYSVLIPRQRRPSFAIATHGELYVTGVREREFARRRNGASLQQLPSRRLLGRYRPRHGRGFGSSRSNLLKGIGAPRKRRSLHRRRRNILATGADAFHSRWISKDSANQPRSSANALRPHARYDKLQARKP